MNYDMRRAKEHTLGCVASPRLYNLIVKQTRSVVRAVRWGRAGAYPWRGEPTATQVARCPLRGRVAGDSFGCPPRHAPASAADLGSSHGQARLRLPDLCKSRVPAHANAIWGKWIVQKLCTIHFALCTALLWGSVAGAAITADAYFPFSGWTEGNSTVALVETPAPLSGILAELRCRMAAANDSDEAWRLTLFVNGVASALTCTIGVSAQTCTDTGHTVPVSVGQRLAYLADSTAGASPSATPTCTAILYEYR